MAEPGSGLTDRELVGLLVKNRKTPFIRRILEPGSYKPLDLGGGKTASHLMAYGESEGRHYVYPTVQQQEDGSLLQVPADEAFRVAMESGNVLPFDTSQDAEWFSQNYKRYWEMRKEQGLDSSDSEGNGR